MRVLAVGLEAHQVDDVHDADLELGEVLAQQLRGGERLERRHVAGAREHDVGLAAPSLLAHSQIPIPARAVLDRLVHRRATAAPAACPATMTLT